MITFRRYTIDYDHDQIHRLEQRLQTYIMNFTFRFGIF